MNALLHMDERLLRDIGLIRVDVVEFIHAAHGVIRIVDGAARREACGPQIVPS